MAEDRMFTWIPFYQELAVKLLEYKDNRRPLIEFVYSDDMSPYTNYLHKEDKTQFKDIDPFSFFGIFNRGQAKWNNRSNIARMIKAFFALTSDVPTDFNGIPVLNALRSFYMQWDNDTIVTESCNHIWNLFVSCMNGNINSHEFDVIMNSKGKGLGMSTIPLFWFKPYEYLALDSRNISYLQSLGVSVNVYDVDSYKNLIQEIKGKMVLGEIMEKSFAEISYNAWNQKNSVKHYWIYAPGENAKYWEDFYDKGIMAIGWEELGDLSLYSKREELKKAMNHIYGEKNRPNDVSCNDDFVNKMNVGDVVFVKKGRKKVLGYGIVTSSYYYDENRAFCKSLRNVDWKAKGEWEHPGAAVLKTLTDITPYTDYIEELKSLFTMNSEVQKLTGILRLKKNIILQGAPGTGKTYNTAALALTICGEQIPENHGEVMLRYEELQKEGRIGFVTFHQSMDYEDFVEGIKPKTENGMVSYEVEDGIFKSISAKAGNNYADSQKTVEVLQKQKDIQERMFDFLSEAQENETEYKTKTGSKFVIKEVTDKNIIIQIPENQVASRIPLRIAELRDLLENDVELKRVSDIKAYFNRQFNTQQDSYTFILVNEIRKIKTKTVTVPKTELQNYVLIIDEINRGNVSKIFGELITLLEADKRIGGDHPIRVTLPYSKESFGVPSNLYIIGTMNTTDRSVGNIDYAVRRRFAFATLKADKELVVNNSIPLAVELFEAVESFIKRHQIDMDFEDLMVGHSYFFAKDENELELKWQYEILPLLNEYIKDGIINTKPISSDKTIANFVGEWHPALAE